MAKMVEQSEIDAVWGNANFGDIPRLDVVKYSVLKCACGYHTGWTARQIVTELGLITKGYKITERGRYCLWQWFGYPVV